jgi:hypothetical protein
MHIGIGISTDRDHIRAVKDAVQAARIQLASEKIDVAIVFSTVDFAHTIVFKTLSNLLKNVPLLGSSTLGIISNQGISTYGIAVLLLSLPKETYFNIACVKNISSKSAVSAGEELGEKLLYGCKGVRRSLTIVFSDGLLQNCPEVIYGIQERLGTSFPLVGASASDKLTFNKTYVYFGDEILTDAACGILLGGKWRFGLGIQHGWKPLGKPRTVTRSSGNIVTQIDNSPASRIYEDYFAKRMTEFKADLKRIAMLYPVGIKIPGEKEYLLRNVIDVNDGTLVFQGDVPQDSTIRLMIGTKESCLEAAAKATEDAKRNLAGQTVKFALIFDSATRAALFKRQAARELETVKSKLGRNIPIIGMYTYAEQAPLSAINYLGKAYFHSHTITLLEVGEL